MPSITIYMREEVFKLLEELRSTNSRSRGKYLTELVVKDAKEKGIRTKRT